MNCAYNVGGTCLWSRLSEGPACRVRLSEERACRVRRATFDHPFPFPRARQACLSERFPGGTCSSRPLLNVGSSLPLSPGTTSVPLQKNVGGTCSSRPLRDVGLSTVIHRARQACLSKKMLEGPACQVRHSTVNVCQAISLSPSIGLKCFLACQNTTEVGGLLSC